MFCHLFCFLDCCIDVLRKPFRRVFVGDSININAQNDLEKNAVKNKADNCARDTSGVILELSKEATQSGFIRKKEQAESTAVGSSGEVSTMALMKYESKVSYKSAWDD